MKHEFYQDQEWSDYYSMSISRTLGATLSLLSATEWRTTNEIEKAYLTNPVVGMSQTSISSNITALRKLGLIETRGREGANNWEHLRLTVRNTNPEHVSLIKPRKLKPKPEVDVAPACASAPVTVTPGAMLAGLKRLRDLLTVALEQAEALERSALCTNVDDGTIVRAALERLLKQGH